MLKEEGLALNGNTPLKIASNGQWAELRKI